MISACRLGLFLSFVVGVTGCAVSEAMVVCESGKGLAVVEKEQGCGSVDGVDRLSSDFDREDPLVFRALFFARKVIDMEFRGYEDFSELREVVGAEVFEELRMKRMSAVYEILPDFSDTLGINTYRIIFMLDSSDRLELLIDADGGQHQWNFLVE